jgi:glycosyltransferase involved in cell wall biosynthesis
MTDQIILVNGEIHNKLSLPKEKCVVMHAFLPPDLEGEPPIPTAIQNDIETARKNGKCIIVANASRLDNFNGEDLYGLDISVDAAIRMKKKNLNFCFIFTVSELDHGKEKYESAIAAIEKNGLQNDFYLHNGVISFPKLIVESDIVIRPTNTDGDSLSVREAIYFGKPIVASDVVTRPEGTLLFKTRNAEHLSDTLEKLMYQIKDDVTYKSEPAHNKNEAALFYSHLINDVLKKS